MTSVPSSRGGTLRGSEFSPRGTLRDSENNQNAIFHDLDIDRRSTLRDERYGTTSTYMSEHQTGTVFIRVSVPELKVQKCLQFELEETVWEAKQRILSLFSKDLRDSLNYGMYLPPMNGRAGKFLEEERMLREYPLHGPIGFLEFKYKRRVYKLIHLNPRKLKQLHNKTNFRQFIEHVKNGNLSKINKLTNKGLDPNFHDSSTGETPLTLAVNLPKEKCREVILSLISGGAHIDFRTKQGQTPIHRAILNGNQAAVKSLLDLGASTNYKDSRGLTPLYYSVLYGKNPACAEMLLHERASIGTQDEQGWFEIHQACKLGLIQHLEHLMFYGADVDVTNASGNTALHICAVNNNEQCTRVLLFRGANKNILNFNNQTPQQVAIIAGNVSLAELIKSHDVKDIVPFREMPTFSSRRPRQSMYSSTLSLLSRSRSDPKLNITSAIDDSNIMTPPSSMRSLPHQMYQMYSDSGSYPASRESDSPRSMSISSNSSGPGKPRQNGLPSPSHSPVNCHNERAQLRKHLSYAGNTRTNTNHFMMDTDFHQELHKMMRRENSHKQFKNTDSAIREETLNEETYENPSVNQELEKTGKQGAGETSPSVFVFPDMFEGGQGHSQIIQASESHDQLQASRFPGQTLDLEPSVSDKIFVCIETYHPTHPAGLWMEMGNTIQVMSVTDTGYWEGSVNGRDGWFPAHHVQEVRLRNKAGSLGDLLGGSRESTLMNRNTLAALIRSDNSDYGPRTVVLQRASEGYGFVLRGAKSQLKPNGDLDFRPSAEFPALQYLDSVDPGSAADRAGLKGGDFILEINGENVVRASHDRVVHLIRGTGDTLAMKVVTVKPGNRAQDWFGNQDKSLTMPNRKKKAPAPPQRDPRTSLSMSRSEGQSVSEELAAMEKLDQAILEKKVSEEKKTASIRSRTAAKRVSCVELENIGVENTGNNSRQIGNLERSKSTPDLLDAKTKARKDIIYATPTVPDKNSHSQKHEYAVPGVNKSFTGSVVIDVHQSPTDVNMRPKGPPPPPPADNSSPKKQAPRPPSSFDAEVVSIKTNKQSPYASANIHIKTDESSYESSFRPGASAKLTEDPGHADDEGDKPSVSFAEDKVYDHAASFLKKHPNAKLLMTSEAQNKVKNRNSQVFEPEPDYDNDSGEDKHQTSHVKLRGNRQSVTVIAVGDKKAAAAPNKNRYTIHSTIPTENKSTSSYNAQSHEFMIPPRPDGPAPSPPNQSPRHQAKKSAAPSPPPSSATPPLPTSVPPPLPQTPPPDFDDDLPLPPSPREALCESAAPPPAPPPPPMAPPPPNAPPPPTPNQLKKTEIRADYLGSLNSIPHDAIAAAVAKRQTRIETEGLKIGVSNKPAKPQTAVETNQAAILAAVARRREKLEQQANNSVVDSIESRLQKTKKLQAAKFQISGVKSNKTENRTSDTKPYTSVQTSIKKKETQNKDIVKPIEMKEKPLKEETKAKSTELSFRVKPVQTSAKLQSGMTEIKSKFNAKPAVDLRPANVAVVMSGNVKKQESLKLKPEPLEKAVSSRLETSSKDQEQSKNEKNVNGQSDFLALAEKKRQEWLLRKQKSPPESKATSPRSSSSGTPEKDKFRTKTVEIKPIEKKSGSPPVSAKPAKTNGTTIKGASYTEFQSSKGLVKVKPLSSVNGDANKSDNTRSYTNVPPPPPGFRDGGRIENEVVQLEIIPPPMTFSSDSGTDMSHQHSPAFSPDTVSVVSSLSTLSSLSGDQNDIGRSNGYDDLIAPPPPGFDDGDMTVIPPPPEFGNENSNKKSVKTFHDKPVNGWLCIDVLDWLDSLNMSQYKNSFQQNCIDGKKLLSLTRNNYIDLGVTQVGHRMNIERSIKKAAIKQSNVSDNIIASEHL